MSAVSANLPQCIPQNGLSTCTHKTKNPPWPSTELCISYWVSSHHTAKKINQRMVCTLDNQPAGSIRLLMLGTYTIQFCAPNILVLPLWTKNALTSQPLLMHVNLDSTGPAMGMDTYSAHACVVSHTQSTRVQSGKWKPELCQRQANFSKKKKSLQDLLKLDIFRGKLAIRNSGTIWSVHPSQLSQLLNPMHENHT